jgi:hypothetical protein
MITKVCKLIDGSTVVGNLTDETLLDALNISLELIKETGDFIPHLFPIMYPLNKEVLGINIPRSRILCVLNETPLNIIVEYQRTTIGGTPVEPTPKPKATLTRIK